MHLSAMHVIQSQLIKVKFIAKKLVLDLMGPVSCHLVILNCPQVWM